MKYTSTCECCRQKVTAYTHKLNAPLILALRALWDFQEREGIGADMGQLGLTTSQYTNFAKLAYWDFAQCHHGKWSITGRGVAFLSCELLVRDTVAVMAREVLPLTHQAWETHTKNVRLVRVNDVMGQWEFKRKPEYQAEKSDQITMPI